MSAAGNLLTDVPAQTRGEIIKLACLAVGGQGGGVLGGWIESTARSQGYVCQATSVAGVAQRTGSTVYYIEMAPQSEKTPVFSLAPSAGDLDIVVGAELMETGRAIMRGFVTPDRTVLIGSTHRVVSIAEKTVPGDGMIGPEQVLAAAEIAANGLFLFDLERVAVENGSVISASLLGALAGSRALPFPRDAFEASIRSGGKGVDASLRAFDAAFALASGEIKQAPAKSGGDKSWSPATISAPDRLQHVWNQLTARLDEVPQDVWPMAAVGLQAVVDYQGPSYGSDYLDRLTQVMDIDSAERDWELSREAAKYIAKAMTYDDVIRVADLKTRASRFERVRNEVRPADGAVMRITEFMHPRAEEIVGLLPTRMGRRWEANPRRMAMLDRFFNKGRRVRSDSLRGFVMLHILGGMRGWRLKTLRHAQEMAHLDNWLGLALKLAATDYRLAIEVLRCRRLIKGYSDTHARANSKFDRVIGAIGMLEGRADAADWIRRLREAALADEQGKALDGALKTVASFAA